MSQESNNPKENAPARRSRHRLRDEQEEVAAPAISPLLARKLLTIVSAFLVLLLFLLQGVSAINMFVFAIFFGLIFWYEREWGVYLFVGWLVVLKFAEAPMYSRLPVQPTDVALALVLLAFVGACFRYLELGSFLSSFYPDAKQAKRTKKIRWRFPELLRGRWWLIPISVAIAAGLMEIFPLDQSSRGELWILPEPARMILLLGFLFGFWFVVRSLILFATRWTMSPGQADIVCRSDFARQLWPEHASIEKRRAKIKVKNSKVS